MSKVHLPPGESVNVHVTWLDLTTGQYGPQLRVRGRIGDTDDGMLYLPATDALNELLACGAIAALPDSLPGPGDGLVEVSVAKRDIIIARPPIPNTKRHGLAITLPPNGVQRQDTPSRPAAASPAAANGAARGEAEPLAIRRARVVAAFGAAIDATLAELVPRLTRGGIAVDGDVAYRLAFSLWKAYEDRGLI